MDVLDGLCWCHAQAGKASARHKMADAISWTRKAQLASCAGCCSASNAAAVVEYLRHLLVTHGVSSCICVCSTSYTGRYLSLTEMVRVVDYNNIHVGDTIGRQMAARVDNALFVILE